MFVSDPELKLPLVAFLDAVEESERNGARCPFYLGKVPLRAELPELDEDLRNAPSDPTRFCSAFVVFFVKMTCLQHKFQEGPILRPKMDQHFCTKSEKDLHRDQMKQLNPRRQMGAVEEQKIASL